MKLKRIIGSALAGAMALSAFVFPSSAAATTITLGGSGRTTYAIEITATGKITKTDFEEDDYVEVDLKIGSTTELDGEDAELVYATLMDSPITKNKAEAYRKSGDNLFKTGTQRNLTWVGVFEFADNTVDPKKKYKLDLGDIEDEFEIEFTYSISGAKETPSKTTYSVDVIETTGKDYVSRKGGLATDEDITAEDYANDGKGFTTAQITAFAEASRVDVTVNLDSALTYAETFRLTTDLTTKSATVKAARGDKKVVFEDVNPVFFYDPKQSSRYRLFETLSIEGGDIYSSIVITLDGSASSSSNTNSNTNTSVAEPEEKETLASINYSSVTLAPGTSVYLTTDMDASGVTRTTTSRNICRVFTSGRIEAVAAGTATITVNGKDGRKATCKVTVKSSSNPYTSLQLSTTSGTVYQGYSYSLNKFTTKTPSTSNDTIYWSSSNSSIATVDKYGKVSVVGTGTVKITATASGGATSSATLSCKAPYVSISSGTSKTIKAGGTTQITAKRGPSSGTLTYSSSNTAVASVSSSGVVTGVKKGSATITVRSSKGGSATVAITVS